MYSIWYVVLSYSIFYGAFKNLGYGYTYKILPPPPHKFIYLYYWAGTSRGIVCFIIIYKIPSIVYCIRVII